MSKAILHPSVTKALADYTSNPAQVLMLVGKAGVGKGSLMQEIISRLLTTPVRKLADNPQLLAVTAEGHIGIDEIRRIQHFLAMKPADSKHQTRVISIENAGRMTLEAQNALLKSIEEPPAESYVLLSAVSLHELLPTIMSRVQTLTVHRPDTDELKAHFKAQGYEDAAIGRALALSGGLPGAMASLLAGDSGHPTLVAADAARKLLQADKFERLIIIDQLAKDREAAVRVCEVLTQMAAFSLKKDGLTPAQRERWQSILATALRSADKLRANVQAKLVLTSMSLSM